MQLQHALRLRRLHPVEAARRTCGLTFIPVDGAEQCANLGGLDDRGVVLHLRRNEGAMQVDTNIPLRTSGGDSISNDATAGAPPPPRGLISPRTSTVRRTVSSSGAVISPMGRSPKRGLAKPSSQRSFSKVAGERPSASSFPSHSSATTLNELPAPMALTPRVSFL